MRNELSVGIFVLIALGLFVGSIFIIGSERQVFSDKVSFFSYYTNVKGLNTGAPVRLGGITIGKVGAITFDEQGMRIDDSVRHVKVTIEIDEESQHLIRSDAHSTIETQGLLGDRFVSISFGGSSNRMEPQSIIPAKESLDIGEVVETVASTLTTASETVEDLSDIVSRVEKEGIDPLVASLRSLSTVIDTAKEGQGVFSKLLNSQELSDDIVASVKNIRAVSEALRTGEGFLPALLFKKGGKNAAIDLETTLRNLSEASASIKEVSTQIQHGDGVLSELLFNRQKTEESLSMSLANSVQNIETITNSLVQGKGTLGALLMDASLYENSVEITDSAKRSFIVREAISQTLK
jgi:phospholipid/cholesterol/gamma-HCH transport system substrate-binding protein